MRALLFLITLGLCINSVFAKADEKAFYRLNIANQNNELMVVKIKGRDLWVTPGLYSFESEFDLSQFKNMASGYGLEISPPTLHGKFLVKPDVDKPYSIRYFYRATALNPVLQMPDFIEEIKWLPLEQALKQINLPHISYLTRQTELFPDKVWGATIDRYKKGDSHKINVIKGFYAVE